MPEQEPNFLRSIFNTIATSAAGWFGAKGGALSGAAVGGGVSGPGGAVSGKVVGGVVGAYAGKKAMSRIMGVGTNTALTPEQKAKLEAFKKAPTVEQNVLLAFAVGGLTKYFLNRMSVPNQAAWRGAHSDINQIRAQMTQEQRDFAAAVLSSDETFRGEMTVVGDRLGSWLTYVHKMILIDEDRARRVFTPIVMTENTSALHNDLVWQMVVEFWTELNPDLMQNVLLASTAAAATAYGLQQLFKSKPKKKEPKKKKKKTKRRPTRRRQVRSATGVRTRGGRKEKSGRKIDTLRALFRRLDKDKSGRLDAKELRVVAKRFNLTGPQLLKRFDKDANGTISFDEFASFMRPRATEI